jgi:hypothetical protein
MTSARTDPITDQARQAAAILAQARRDAQYLPLPQAAHTALADALTQLPDPAGTGRPAAAGMPDLVAAIRDAADRLDQARQDAVDPDTAARLDVAAWHLDRLSTLLDTRRRAELTRLCRPRTQR